MQLQRLIKLFIQQFRGESGAIAVMFAIMSPLLLMFYSMAFDGANMQASRARLADGLNQGILAVAMVDNRNSNSANKAENIQLLRNYLEYYLPNATIPLDDLDIEVTLNYLDTNELKSVDYSASGMAIVKPSLGATAKAQGRPGFDAEANIWASGGAGVVRKSLEKIKYPTDYAFVVDFSGSMLDSSAEPGLSRIQLLQKVVTEFSRTVLEDNEETTVGIIPFGVGVPVALNKKNLAGGNEFGCSYVGKLKREYKDVDLDFWYNKNRQTNSNVTISKQSFDHDTGLGFYYNDVIRLATGRTLDNMVAAGWCVMNSSSGEGAGRYIYSCDADPRSNLFSNYSEFSRTRSAALSLMINANSHYTIANSVTMDFAATLADDYMFTEEAVTTYVHHYSILNDRPFFYMCNSALQSSPALTYQQLANGMRTADKPASYLIELTSNPAVLDEFAQMKVLVNVGTDSSGGLLRSLPVIAKGVNERKIIIVVSDGDDSGTSASGPLSMTNTLHRTYKICDRIKSGLLKYPQGTQTKQSDIYFISVVDDRSTGSRINFWADNCVGKDNAIVATDYQNLMNVLMGIAQKGNVNFINKDEE